MQIGNVMEKRLRLISEYLENQLKLKDHITLVSSRVSRAIAMIKYAKTFLPIEILKLLYHGLIEPHLRCCCSVWSFVGLVLAEFLRSYKIEP